MNIMTADEVAKELRVCKATVIKRIKDQSSGLKGFRQGAGRNPYLVLREDFEAYVRAIFKREER